MPLPICFLGFEQNGNAEKHDNARATAVSWPQDTHPHGVWHNPFHLHFDKSSNLSLSTTGAPHALKDYVCISFSFQKSKEALRRQVSCESRNWRVRNIQHALGPLFSSLFHSQGKGPTCGVLACTPLWVSPGVSLPSVTQSILGEAFLFL